MWRSLAALVVLAASAGALVAVAPASRVAARERVEIQIRQDDSFVLTPLTNGAIKRDTGVMSACCWSRRFIKRDGESIEINDPQLTFTGDHGTFVFRNRIEWGDLPDGWAVFTGTWKFVRGTGVYAGLSGSGHVAGVTVSDTGSKARLEGLLGRR